MPRIKRRGKEEEKKRERKKKGGTWTGRWIARNTRRDGEEREGEEEYLTRAKRALASTKHFGRSRQRYNLPVCLALFILLAC